MSSSAAAEKTEEELRKEIDELHRQQRQITERLRDPRGIRRGGLPSGGPRNFASNGAPHRGLVRPADRNGTGDQPPAKKRLLSAVFKVEDGEIVEDDVKNKVTDEESDVVAISNQDELKPLNLRPSGRSWNQRSLRRESDIPADNHIPRVLPKNEDPSLVSRNKRMLGQLLGTLEKFRKEDMKLSGTEAYTKRSNALQKAEQRAREESERLRLEEREKIAEKRRRDLVLRARVAAKAEEKKLELLFLRWAEHQKKLSNFIRTKAEPPIYYMPKKPLEEDATMQQQRSEQLLAEWKAARREEVTEYQKQIEAQYLENVEKELERWQNARSARKANNDVNLQETMDQELESHRLEHGPKTRKIPGGGGDNEDEDEDEVEDINVGEDENDMMDDMLVVEDKGMKADDAVAVAVEVANTEGGNGNGSPISKQQQLE
ncbi:PNN [Linum perenne]